MAVVFIPSPATGVGRLEDVVQFHEMRQMMKLSQFSFRFRRRLSGAPAGVFPATGRGAGCRSSAFGFVFVTAGQGFAAEFLPERSAFGLGLLRRGRRGAVGRNGVVGDEIQV